MNGIPIEVVVVGGGLGLVILAVILLKFGKAIARFCLTLGGLVVVVVIGLAILGQGAAQFQTASAAKEAAKVAKIATTGATLNTLLTTACVGGLATLILVGVLGSASLYVKRELDKRREQQRVQQLPEPTGQPAQRDYPPVVYVQPQDELQQFNAQDWGW